MRTLLVAGIAGIVGLVAGRGTRPELGVTAVPAIAAPPPSAVMRVPAPALGRGDDEETVEIDCDDGADIGDILAAAEQAMVERGGVDTTITVEQQHTIDHEYSVTIPVPRTFESVLGEAAGSSGDLYGASFNGIESMDNVYMVEAIDEADVKF